MNIIKPKIDTEDGQKVVRLTNGETVQLMENPESLSDEGLQKYILELDSAYGNADFVSSVHEPDGGDLLYPLLGAGVLTWTMLNTGFDLFVFGIMSVVVVPLFGFSAWRHLKWRTASKTQFEVMRHLKDAVSEAQSREIAYHSLHGHDLFGDYWMYVPEKDEGEDKGKDKEGGDTPAETPENNE